MSTKTLHLFNAGDLMVEPLKRAVHLACMPHGFSRAARES